MQNVFRLDLDEVTFEMNPDDVTAEYLSGLKQLGITRGSMGVQSFQPELLQFMHRAHTREEAIKSLELLGNAGFNSFTVDLIYGNPGQSTPQFLQDVELLIKFEPPHISAYSLTVEANTRLGKQVEIKRIIPAEDDMVTNHFKALNARLKESGMFRYEVSSYSIKGQEAIHNSNYWRHENYLGLGPAAHSFWWSPKRAGGREQTTKKARRWQNAADLKNYPTQTEQEFLTRRQLVEERIMMGLRTRNGVSLAELKERYDFDLNVRQMDYLNQKEQQGKVIFDNSICLTDAGIIIADAIILDLVTL